MSRFNDRYAGSRVTDPPPRAYNEGAAPGFSLLEVLIALAVLVIGISAMAALTATTLTRGRQSKYTSLAATLASEKLEDLNRWSISYDTTNQVYSVDPQVCVQTADTSEGSLTTDVSKSIQCGDYDAETVYYYDNLSIDMTNSSSCPNPAAGCFAESASTSSGYLTTYHSPDGVIPGPNGPVASTVAPNNVNFHRRWMIEANPVVNGTALSGARRITVLVTLTDQSIQPPVSFQESIIRP